MADNTTNKGFKILKETKDPDTLLFSLFRKASIDIRKFLHSSRDDGPSKSRKPGDESETKEGPCRYDEPCCRDALVEFGQVLEGGEVETGCGNFVRVDSRAGAFSDKEIAGNDKVRDWMENYRPQDNGSQNTLLRHGFSEMELTDGPKIRFKDRYIPEIETQWEDRKVPVMGTVPAELTSSSPDLVVTNREISSLPKSPSSVDIENQIAQKSLAVNSVQDSKDVPCRKEDCCRDNPYLMRDATTTIYDVGAGRPESARGSRAAVAPNPVAGGARPKFQMSENTNRSGSEMGSQRQKSPRNPAEADFGPRYENIREERIVPEEAAKPLLRVNSKQKTLVTESYVNPKNAGLEGSVGIPTGTATEGSLTTFLADKLLVDNYEAPEPNFSSCSDETIANDDTYIAKSRFPHLDVSVQCVSPLYPAGECPLAGAKGPTAEVEQYDEETQVDFTKDNDDGSITSDNSYYRSYMRDEIHEVRAIAEKYRTIALILLALNVVFLVVVIAGAAYMVFAYLNLEGSLEMTTDILIKCEQSVS